MRTSKKYTRELKKQFGYLATWLPSTPLALGDIGILRKNQFIKISNLEDLGISFEVEEDTTKADIEYNSQGSVSITAKASGTIAPKDSMLKQVDTGLTVAFSRKNSIVFKANGTTSPSIKDQIKLGNEVLQLYKEGKWSKNWVVVTELVNAESATILISSASDSKIELVAKNDVAIHQLDIADASLNLGVIFSRGLATQIVAQSNLTPLFRASKVKGRFLASPVFRTKGIAAMDLMTPAYATSDETKIYFGEADFEEDAEEV